MMVAISDRATSTTESFLRNEEPSLLSKIFFFDVKPTGSYVHLIISHHGNSAEKCRKIH